MRMMSQIEDQDWGGRKKWREGKDEDLEEKGWEKIHMKEDLNQVDVWMEGAMIMILKRGGRERRQEQEDNKRDGELQKKIENDRHSENRGRIFIPKC